jgi:tetratricopeptide (TPR) repeat protein
VPEAEAFDFDVFISYSSRDKDWVRGTLLPRLEAGGVRAFIDYRDFTRGAPSIKEVERGVLRSRKTLLVLTPDYVQSAWAEIESIMLAVLDPANRDLRCLPLLKAACTEPLRIHALTHIDFTEGADTELAWRQLLTALGKPPQLESPTPPEREGWFLAHPYPMPPHFTGRLAERRMLDAWLSQDPDHPLLSLRALGGFGKSALAWHWLTHDVKPAAWPRVVWWSFYEGDASFDHFLAETLFRIRGVEDREELVGKNAVVSILKHLQQPGTLLVLDGFERALRAFGGLDAAYRGDTPADVTRDGLRSTDCDCISPLAHRFLYHLALQPGLHAKVLLTTRLCPAVLRAKGGGLLQGCREEALRQLWPADAAELFRRQGIRGTRAEIEEACVPYGYHPLSLRLLAGLIVGDLQQPGDIAASKRLDVSGDLVQRQHHVLQAAYDSLTRSRQALLSRIACFRSPVKYDALKALAETPSKGGNAQSADLDTDLRDLLSRGLLHHDTQEARFDLHPIVRRYAYGRLAAPERLSAHASMRDYFAAVSEQEKVTCLGDLAPVIELYHHTVRAGQLDEAHVIFSERIYFFTYYQLGAYQLSIDLLRGLFPDGESHFPRLKSMFATCWTLAALANCYGRCGQPHRAARLYWYQNTIQERIFHTRNRAVGLSSIASHQLAIGALRSAEANLRRSIELSREISEKLDEAIGCQELGRLLAYRGAYREAADMLATALNAFEKLRAVHYQGLVWAYSAHRELLMLRSPTSPLPANPKDAMASAQRALELADRNARTRYPHEHDYVQGHWLLGATYQVAGRPTEAEQHLHEALERCRRINCVEHEADILIDLARLRAATGSPDEARRLAEEALTITERCGYVLQGADAHLVLAQLALARGNQTEVKEHAQQARTLATCDGPPDYTYYAAYTEACALLKP